MWFRRKPNDIDKRIRGLYQRYERLAERFGFVFSRCRLTAGGRPNVLLIGNHSSGKSSWVNYLLGDDAAPVQATGVAPTDDSFTVIVHGQEDSEHHGPAALRELPEDFAMLERLGPAFLRRLKVKRRNRPLLEKINLIDSPGMIDSAMPGVRRDYNFMASVRRVAEISDLILFLFDPDKPGTTAESLLVIREALPGMSFKVRFLMNKSDTFENMHDFARAYGALCWNLARVLSTKDLPIVHTTYVPVAHAGRDARIDLADLDRGREALVDEVRRAGERRVDNIVAQVRQDLTRLAMHVRVAANVRRRLLGVRLRQVLGGTAAVALAGGAVALAVRQAEHGALPQILAALPVAAAVGITAWWICARAYARTRVAMVSLDHLDATMREVYLRELATERRDDLEQCWLDVREQTRQVLDRLGESLPWFAGSSLVGLEATLEDGLVQRR